MVIYYVAGIKFLLNNISIPTDGSGRVLVTDIQYNPTEALICQSSSVGDGLGDWYLDREGGYSTDRIYGPNYRGWTRERASIDGYRVVRLKRVSDTAVEGRFTCRIPGGSDGPRGLLILHPSESVVYWGMCNVYCPPYIHSVFIYMY